MMGMLVLQDVEVSLIMGCLPFLADHAPRHVLHSQAPVRKLHSVPHQVTGHVQYLFLLRVSDILVLVVIICLVYERSPYVLGAHRIRNFKPDRTGSDQDEKIRLAGLD
jgi:hypothetical protein